MPTRLPIELSAQLEALKKQGAAISADRDRLADENEILWDRLAHYIRETQELSVDLDVAVEMKRRYLQTFWLILKWHEIPNDFY